MAKLRRETISSPNPSRNTAAPPLPPLPIPQSIPSLRHQSHSHHSMHSKFMTGANSLGNGPMSLPLPLPLLPRQQPGQTQQTKGGGHGQQQRAFVPEFTKPLRIVACGTLFLTHTLSVPRHPSRSSTIRAHAVERMRGGSANMVLSLLAQFPAIEPVLVAPLGGNEDGYRILRDLEAEGIITQYCKIWPGAGVPSAWVLHSAEDNARTVINHNPLPDITHEDFVSLLGPLLAPENYPESYKQLQQQQQQQQLYQPHPVPLPLSNTLGQRPSRTALTGRPNTSGGLSPTGGGNSNGSSPRPSQSSSRPPLSLSNNPNSPAPFDWLHFEGRSVKTTLSNITGLDGLARERKWRSHCVFSVDIGKKVRQGVEALIPHADVLFVSKQYAQAHSPHYATTPRAFLLSLSSSAPPHALLVAYWGKDGAAVLSLPTREYFQSSGWVEERPPPVPGTAGSAGVGSTGQERGGERDEATTIEMKSVRSGSDFWADGRSRTSSSAYTLSQQIGRYLEGDSSMAEGQSGVGQSSAQRESLGTSEEYDDIESDVEETRTERGAPGQTVGEGGNGPEEGSTQVDEVGAQDAFVAGMIYALSRRICPGAPYTPSAGGREDASGSGAEDVRARWRLDECLRFAIELSGRKGRRKTWDGLAEETVRTGWFDP